MILKKGKLQLSVVTSGDSKYWPKKSNGSFKNQVFVILQKPKSMIDIYNVTKMLEVFEQSFADPGYWNETYSFCLHGRE